MKEDRKKTQRAERGQEKDRGLKEGRKGHRGLKEGRKKAGLKEGRKRHRGLKEHDLTKQMAEREQKNKKRQRMLTVNYRASKGEQMQDDNVSCAMYQNFML